MENINTMLVYGIVVGCVFILLAMVIHIVNGIKNKNFKRIWLEGNGVVRLAFVWVYFREYCLLF